MFIYHCSYAWQSLSDTTACFYKSGFNLGFCYHDHLRQLLTSFRLGSHKLEIEIGKINNVIIEHRTCEMCYMKSIGLEFFILSCVVPGTEVYYKT